MINKDGDEENYSMNYYLNKDKINDEGEITATVKKGEKIGTAEIVVEGEDFGYIFGENDQQVDLVATDSVEKSNWFMLTLSAIGEFFVNLFTSLIDMIKGWF